MDEIREAFDTGAQEPNQCANSPPGYMRGRYIKRRLGLTHCKMYIFTILFNTQLPY